MLITLVGRLAEYSSAWDILIEKNSGGKTHLHNYISLQATDISHDKCITNKYFWKFSQILFILRLLEVLCNLKELQHLNQNLWEIVTGQNSKLTQTFLTAIHSS